MEEKINFNISKEIHFETSGETFGITVHISNASPDKMAQEKKILESLLDEILRYI